jgi:hypothetical protein
MERHGELLIPPVAIGDPEAAEMVRAWVAKKTLHCTLRIGVWKDAGTWGILLADMARHVANAHHEQDGADVEACLKRIRAAFVAEMDSPTDKPSGAFA